MCVLVCFRCFFFFPIQLVVLSAPGLHMYRGGDYFKATGQKADQSLS